PLVQGWLAEFSDTELAGHPALALAAAYSFLAAGNAAEARHLAVAVAAATECMTGPAASPTLDAGLACIEAMVGVAGIAEMAEAAQRASAIERRDSPWRPLYLFLHATALYL